MRAANMHAENLEISWNSHAKPGHYFHRIYGILSHPTTTTQEWVGSVGLARLNQKATRQPVKNVENVGKAGTHILPVLIHITSSSRAMRGRVVQNRGKNTTRTVQKVGYVRPVGLFDSDTYIYMTM